METVLTRVRSCILDETFTYDGSQLRPHWIYERTGILGDAAVAFPGPCDVHFEHMIDVEDRRGQSRIQADSMLHFIVEHFDAGLDIAVLRQHLLVAVVAERLNMRLGNASVRREGSDLFVGEGKLSVSIATASAVSSLIHIGVNVTNSGTPVRTCSLSDLGVDPHAFAEEVLNAYAEEIEAVRRARCKARPV